MTADPSSVPTPSSVRIPGTGRNNQWSEEWWKTAPPNVKRCTAHNRKGNQCLHAAMVQMNVCRTHGGAAPQCKRAARVRLEMAADRMAKELLGIATGAESEAVRLAAIREALDRSGLAAKTAVEVEVSTKSFELVFEKIASGPREPTTQPTLAELPESAADDEIVGEFDDDPPDDGDEVKDSGYTDSESVIDVEIVNPDADAQIMADDPGPIPQKTRVHQRAVH
jgi:hypothetical protein